MAENKYRIRSALTKGAVKVPVIMQREAPECGAASLAMIMAYYGKWLPLDQVCSDCSVSHEGSNAKNIALAAQSYGFEVVGCRRSFRTIREKGIFPCIIHWNYNHFVVLDGFRGKYAYINDPARGFVKVTAEEFDEAFAGVAVFITPGENFIRTGKEKAQPDLRAKGLPMQGGSGFSGVCGRCRSSVWSD